MEIRKRKILLPPKWLTVFVLVVDHVSMNQKIASGLTILGANEKEHLWRCLCSTPNINHVSQVNHVLNRLIDDEIWPTQRFPPPRNPRKSEKMRSRSTCRESPGFSVSFQQRDLTWGCREYHLVERKCVARWYPSEKKEERYSKTNSSPSRMDGWEMKCLSFLGQKKASLFFSGRSGDAQSRTEVFGKVWKNNKLYWR